MSVYATNSDERQCHYFYWVKASSEFSTLYIFPRLHVVPYIWMQLLMYSQIVL